MHDFVAYPSFRRRVLILLTVPCFLAIGLWMIGAFGPPPSSSRTSQIEYVWIGWLTLLVFGSSGVIVLLHLFDSAEVLRIGTDGISYPQWSPQLIAWHEIVGVSTYRRSGQRFIVLRLKDGPQFPERKQWWVFGWIDRKVTGGDVKICLTGTDRSYDEAMRAMARFGPT